MPLLRGGIKYRQKRKPFGTRTKNVKYVRELGMGSEGIARLFEYTLKKGRRTRKVQLVQKEFHRENITSPYISYKNPRKQFEIIQELIELNRTKKLGLNLPRTVRLQRTHGKLVLVLTYFPGAFSFASEHAHRMTPNESSELWHEMRRQESILIRNGYYVTLDSWFTYQDPKTKKHVVVLGDFSSVEPL